MNLYYITSIEVWKTHTDSFHPGLGSHYIDLPDGRILLSADFPNHSSLEIWEQKQGVELLPHPVFEGTKKLDKKHVDALQHLGVTADHTVVDVARIAGAVMPTMKLRHF